MASPLPCLTLYWSIAEKKFKRLANAGQRPVRFALRCCNRKLGCCPTLLWHSARSGTASCQAFSTTRDPRDTPIRLATLTTTYTAILAQARPEHPPLQSQAHFTLSAELLRPRYRNSRCSDGCKERRAKPGRALRGGHPPRHTARDRSPCDLSTHLLAGSACASLSLRRQPREGAASPIRH